MADLGALPATGGEVGHASLHLIVASITDAYHSHSAGRACEFPPHS